MRIAQIAPIEEVVPPRKYGGTELVVSNVTEELVKRGHDVTLFASGDSKTSAKLVPLCPKAIREMTQTTGQDKVREAWKYLAMVDLVKLIKKDHFDIIHQHFGWRITPMEPLFGIPTVSTCHGPLTPDYIQLVYNKFAKNNYITISDAQRRGNPNLNFLATVYNGIDVESFKYSDDPKVNTMAFLGRMSPEKGPAEAIEIAQKSNKSLKMAAKIDLVDKDYYTKSIAPGIDDSKIKYVGEIGPDEKNEFLSTARALLAPLQWEEPFGLYFTEAMSCGTPVLAYCRGSVPEIVKDGVTGFVVNASDTDKRGDWIIKKTGIKGMLEAVEKIYTMSDEEYKKMRQNCRDHAIKNFSIQKMVDDYELAYQKAINNFKS